MKYIFKTGPLSQQLPVLENFLFKKWLFCLEGSRITTQERTG